MAELNYQIIEAGPEWADAYRLFCRQAYLKAYVRPELGVTEDQFTEAGFNLDRVKKYFNDAFNTGEDHKAWLAIADGEILGGVVAYDLGEFAEMQAFYVKPELKGHGIGHALYQKVLNFAGDKQIQVDVVRYMTETIDMYKHWGFVIDESKGLVDYDWVEWPDKPRAAYRGVVMIKPASKT